MNMYKITQQSVDYKLQILSRHKKCSNWSVEIHWSPNGMCFIYETDLDNKNLTLQIKKMENNQQSSAQEMGRVVSTRNTCRNNYFHRLSRGHSWCIHLQLHHRHFSSWQHKHLSSLRKRQLHLRSLRKWQLLWLQLIINKHEIHI